MKILSLIAPISEKLSRKVLSLPISEHINRNNIEFICNSIRNFYKLNKDLYECWNNWFRICWNCFKRRF